MDDLAGEYGLADYELADHESEDQQEARSERESVEELWEMVNS